MSTTTITLSSDPVTRPRRTAAHLYIVFDSEHPAGEVARYALEAVSRIEIGRGSVHHAARGETGLRVDRCDTAMSSRHAELRFERGGWTIADLGSKNGVWVDGRQVTSAALMPATIVQLGHTFVTLGPPVDLTLDDVPDLVLRDDPATVGPMTMLPSLRAALADLDRIARSPTPIVLIGPTGTGKERMAQRAHARSGRTGPLVSCEHVHVMDYGDEGDPVSQQDRAAVEARIRAAGFSTIATTLVHEQDPTTSLVPRSPWLARASRSGWMDTRSWRRQDAR